MGVWIFLIFALLQYIMKQMDKNKRASKVTVDELTKRFSYFTSVSELTMEYYRLISLNRSNPEATRVIEQAYLAAKARLHAQGSREGSQQGSRSQTRRQSKQEAKDQSIREKNEKIFSNITTLEELKKKYRKLSKANHPDRGGNLTAMKRLNELYEEALKRISLNS